MQAVAAPNTNAAKSVVPKTELSRLDVDKAVAFLVETYPGSVSTSRCAVAIRLAIAAGGIKLKSFPVQAKQYGPTLVGAGFVKLSKQSYREKKGDIAVLQNYEGGNIAGHITMYDGTTWRSDFVQRDMWSGPGYRAKKPPYEIYRP